MDYYNKIKTELTNNKIYRKNIKESNQDKTIEIIICKQDNVLILKKIYEKEKNYEWNIYRIKCKG